MIRFLAEVMATVLTLDWLNRQLQLFDSPTMSYISAAVGIATGLVNDTQTERNKPDVPPQG